MDVFSHIRWILSTFCRFVFHFFPWRLFWKTAFSTSQRRLFIGSAAACVACMVSRQGVSYNKGTPRNHPAICLGFSIVNYRAIGVPPFLCMWKGCGTMYLCICLELWEPKIWSQRTRHGTRGGRCQVLSTTVFLFFHVMAPGQSLESLAKAQAWTGFQKSVQWGCNLFFLAVFLFYLRSFNLNLKPH